LISRNTHQSPLIKSYMRS